MKLLSKLILFFLAISLQGVVAQKSENETRARLVNGLANNDQHAFEEVSKLPLNQAAPLLLTYVDDASTNRERAEHAREIIRKMPGFSNYMKKRILDKRVKAGGEYEMDEFRLLEAIGGDESAAAAAPFLFIDDPTLLVADDYAAGPVNSMALNALVGMHLPDAPAERSYPGYTAPDISDWKAWAEKKGYRDVTIPSLMTLEQKGVSANAIARSNAILDSAKVTSTVTPTPPSSSVLPPTSTTTSTQSNATATPAAAEEKPAAMGFPIMLVVIMAAVVGGAAVFFFRRKDR